MGLRDPSTDALLMAAEHGNTYPQHGKWKVNVCNITAAKCYLVLTRDTYMRRYMSRNTSMENPSMWIIPKFLYTSKGV